MAISDFRCTNIIEIFYYFLDEWKNHFIGHYRLNGMQAVKVKSLELVFFCR